MRTPGRAGVGSAWAIAGLWGCCLAASAQSATSIVVTVTSDITTTLLWQDQYKITASSAGEGTVIGTTNDWIDAGGIAHVTAIPAADCVFAGWTGDTNGTELAGATITVPMTGSRAITANFAIDQHTLTVGSLYGGAFPGTVTTNYGAVLAQSITNSPVTLGGTTQYVCAGWAMTGNEPAGGSATNFTMTLTNNAALTWLWKTNYWLATATNGPGTVSVASGWQGLGSNVLVTAAALAHYHFVNWSGDTNGATIAGTNITVAVTGPKSVTANFAIDRHTLAVASAWGAPVPAVGFYTNDYGTQLTNRVSSQDTRGTTQYVCTGWAMAGNEPAGGSASNFTMTLTNNAALTWLWKTNYWLATATNGPGTVSVASGWQGLGSNVLVTAAAAPHYHFVSWSGDTNGSTGSGTNITVAMTGPKSLTANFAIDRHTLAVASPYGGAFPGTVTTNYGTALVQAVTNSPVTLSGSTQYVCVAASVTGNSFTQVSPTNVTLTLTNNAVLTWQWTTNYWLGAQSEEHGYVAGTQGWYAAGSAAQLEAVASNYYHFLMWTGTVTTSTNPLLLRMQYPHVLSATPASTS